jgi:Na+/H+ antiporter NhaD/arsenite permease-like protein
MGVEQVEPNPWMMLPFGLLLVLLALGPLLFPAWWARHYPKVTGTLAVAVVAYYFLGLHASARIWEVAHEYLSFIAVTGSLFVVSGGIHVNVKGEATPLANTLFLLIGALLANVLGTTGASMLLIQPWLRMNRYRVTGYHVAFFIFIVSNAGGCLTPIGPPLFLGYLTGVPFWWVTGHCLPMWTVGVGALLLMFLAVDRRNYMRAPRPVRAEQTGHEEWRLNGLANLFFLGVILAAVFMDHPPFLREGLMLVAALGSWLTTSKSVHEANHFNFHPIQEVAILFVGIFATMLPALDWLQGHASGLGATTPALFYWGAGGLSSVLDNAPTYLCFLKAIFGLFVDPDAVRQVHALILSHGAGLGTLAGAHAEEIRRTFFSLQKYHPASFAAGTISTDQIEVAFVLGNAKANSYILAVSIGSVFFGAATYIGNGPNFMVKAIAEHQKIHTPDFLTYVVKYTLPFLLPTLVLVWFLFFRP